MNRNIIFSIALLWISSLTACKKNLVPDLRPVDVNVNIAYAAASKLPLQNLTISIKNLETGLVEYAITDQNGKAVFKEISSGTYDISVKREFTATEYLSLTGEQEPTKVVFNAGETNYKIKTNNGNYQLNMTLKKGINSPWVIKQLYYAGSDLYDGASLRDNFFEIYNNTDQVLYADGLYFMFVYGRMSTTYRLENLLLPSGQFDWTKALGTAPAPANANEDFLYAQAIYRFPGTGTSYPVQPGTGLVVARSAINHKMPFTNKNGKVYTVNKPNLTVDLSGADFEVITTPYLEPGDYASLIDIPTPGKTSLLVIQKFATTMMMDNIGRIGYAIFKTDEDVSKWPRYAEVKETSIQGKTLYTQVPKRFVLDAVETQPSTPDRRLPKKLSPELDAGFGFVPGGSYSSQALMRKVDRVENGRRILKDTNNSTEDFEWIMPAIPGGFK